MDLKLFLFIQKVTDQHLPMYITLSKRSDMMTEDNVFSLNFNSTFLSAKESLET